LAADRPTPADSCSEAKFEYSRDDIFGSFTSPVSNFLCPFSMRKNKKVFYNSLPPFVVYFQKSNLNQVWRFSCVVMTKFTSTTHQPMHQ
jgi:hypothetical protein